MAYTPNTWQTGDVVTAQKLNHLEGGVAGTVYVIHVIDEEISESAEKHTLDKTWQEIYDAASAGAILMIVEHWEGGCVQTLSNSVVHDPDPAVGYNVNQAYFAATADDYPTYTD